MKYYLITLKLSLNDMRHHSITSAICNNSFIKFAANCNTLCAELAKFDISILYSKEITWYDFSEYCKHDNRYVKFLNESIKVSDVFDWINVGAK